MGYLVIGLATRLLSFFIGSRPEDAGSHLHWDRQNRAWSERKLAG